MVQNIHEGTAKQPKQLDPKVLPTVLHFDTEIGLQYHSPLCPCSKVCFAMCFEAMALLESLEAESDTSSMSVK